MRLNISAVKTLFRIAETSPLSTSLNSHSPQSILHESNGRLPVRYITVQLFLVTSADDVDGADKILKSRKFPKYSALEKTEI
jgi:hypothetical protein